MFFQIKKDNKLKSYKKFRKLKNENMHKSRPREHNLSQFVNKVTITHHKWSGVFVDKFVALSKKIILVTKIRKLEVQKVKTWKYP